MLHQTPKTTGTRPVPQNQHNAFTVGDIIRWPLSSDPAGVALIVEVEAIAGWQVLTIAPGLADHA